MSEPLMMLGGETVSERLERIRVMQETIDPEASRRAAAAFLEQIVRCIQFHDVEQVGRCIFCHTCETRWQGQLNGPRRPRPTTPTRWRGRLADGFVAYRGLEGRAHEVAGRNPGATVEEDR